MNELIKRYAAIPQRTRWTAALGLYAALAGAYYMLVHSPRTATIEHLLGRYNQLQTQQIEKKAYVDNLAKYEARITELQESLRIARAMLPDDAAVPEFLAQLGHKARQAGLIIERFEPKEENAKDFFAEIVFEMRVRGTYHEIASFIDAIGRLDRIVTVSGLSMAQPKTEDQKIIVRGSFNIETYRSITEEERQALQQRKNDKMNKKNKKR